MLVLGMADVPTWLLLTVGVIMLLLWYSYVKFRHFENLGIPGPKPWPLLGNLPDFFSSGNEALFTIYLKYKEKYGNVVGIYVGPSPSTIIYDYDLISQVLVKEFDNFTNRRGFDAGDKLFESGLGQLKDDHWKHVRSMMSPTFTTGKLRQMAGEINRCARQLAQNVTCALGAVDVRQCCGNYTMDVIASTAFGLRVDSQSSKDNPFVVNARKIMDIKVLNPLFLITLAFPKFSKFLYRMGYSVFDKSGVKFFIDIAKQTLHSRTEGDVSRSDFIQLMTNAKRGEDICTKGDEQEVQQLGANTSRKGLTENEILANALVFFLAGYDVTMSGLTLLLYCLACNPQCQHKVIEEIDKVIGDEEDVTYDDVMKMHYLDKCMQESLRIYPPGPRIDRRVKEDTTINGVPFKKGTVVIVPIYALHMDPEVWPEPERFDPERFSKEEKAKRGALAWMAFGYGPRQCIGTRLAMYELKVAVVHILRNHKLVPCKDTQIPIEWQKRKWLKPKNGIWLAVEKRR